MSREQVHTTRRKRRPVAMAVVCALALASCSQNIGTGFLDTQPQPAPDQPVGPVSGDVIGQGSVRVAMILPKSATGTAGSVAQELRNAADLGLRDFQGADVQIVVKDDAGTTDGGQAAAQEAVNEGARLILGPLFSVSVRGAANPARQAGVPIVSFSTDTSVAARGVYLFGFLPATDTDRIVSFAASQGKRSFAALLPNNAYGAVVEASFRQAVAKAGGRILAVERYSGDDLNTKAQAISRVAGQIDALFIPDQADAAAQVAGALQSLGVDRRKVQFLGSGQWDSPAAHSAASLQGAWYPAPDQSGIATFRARYRAAYGGEPTRVAVLGYEAAVLAAGLVRAAGPQPFRDDVLQSRNGFTGVTGIFRFNPDGTNDRGLAVYEIGSGGPRTISPAPRSFDGRS